MISTKCQPFCLGLNGLIQECMMHWSQCYSFGSKINVRAKISASLDFERKTIMKLTRHLQIIEATPLNLFSGGHLQNSPESPIMRFNQQELEGKSQDFIMYRAVCISCINSSPPGQNGCHFSRWHFQMKFLNEKDRILIQISLKFVSRSPVDKKPAK